VQQKGSYLGLAENALSFFDDTLSKLFERRSDDRFFAVASPFRELSSGL
jgi:hypothetical protein